MGHNRSYKPEDIRFPDQVITESNLVDEMEKSYIEYAMSVIVGRALPDVRDGLKPVHRRILYTMYESGLTSDKPFKKSATCVGDVLGKYHPHGDASVYDAMVRLAQDFSMRYLLVDGHGNFGSVDGDPPAAYRYTEARLSKISNEMLRDIDKDTVDWDPNFDETRKEPRVLPSRFPNLLVNGSSGIAVGMATNIPPHNLAEVIDACVCVLDDPEATLADLMEHISGPDFPTGGIIMLALVDNQKQPKILSLRQIIDEYLKHQEEVLTRRTRYDLKKAQERAHLLEGLLIAQDNIDEVIHIIRSAYDDAKQRLMDRFKLDDVQAQAILDMRLKALQGLDREKLQSEYDELEEKIKYYLELLADENKLKAVLRGEMIEIRDKFGDKRKTEIQEIEDEIDIEDLIEEETCAFTLSNQGYIKRMPVDTYRTQSRGGRGVNAQNLKEEDYVKSLTIASTHDHMLFFTDQGRVHHRKGYQIPEAGRTARGTAIVNVLPLNPGESVTAMVITREFDENEFLMMVTRKGTVKRIPFVSLKTNRKAGIRAITLDEDDHLINVIRTNGDDDIVLATAFGYAICFNENDVRCMGRDAAGVRGIMLTEGDYVVGAEKAEEGKTLLTVTQNGYGKRTALTEYLRTGPNGEKQAQSRGGKGLKNYNITPKTGNVAGCRVVSESDDVMLIENGGVIIRIPASSINVYKRDVQGVIVMRIDDGNQVVSLERVEKMDEEETGEQA